MPDASTQISPPQASTNAQLPGGVIVPPPKFQFVDFPASIAIAAVVLGAVALMLFTNRFDPTRGALTVSLLIILAFVGVLAYSVTVTVPRDETTAAVIGALVAGFGGVITFWLKARNGGDKS